MTGASVRYPELDAFRGAAVIMMVIFHFFIDLSFLGIDGSDPYSGVLKWFGIVTASLFLIIAGISAHITYEKTNSSLRQIQGFIKRGTKLILIGFVITLVTWWFLQGEGYVVFGILHLIGFGIILTPILHRFGMYALLIAGGLLIISSIGSIPYGPLWLAWAGIHPEIFSSIDYTPIIPWLSMFITGLCIGQILYPKGRQQFQITGSILRLLPPFVYTGRHSLFIYLIHQPVMIVVLSIITGKSLI